MQKNGKMGSKPTLAARPSIVRFGPPLHQPHPAHLTSKLPPNRGFLRFPSYFQ
jgi:hypothetical protein